MANASDVIRVGIIGCGGIANGKHMPSLSKVPGVEMVAFCDLILERAEKAKADFGTPDAQVYTDYKKLLEQKDIDVIHVCTPNRSHSYITVDALESGRDVMCEKPMAINSVEAKKMIDASKKTGKLLTIGYQTRQASQAQYIKREAELGTFGDIYFARAFAVRRRAVPNWGVFMNEYEQGGGPLIDIGTHSLDLTLWFMDNYKPKYCVGTSYHKLAPQEKDQGNDWGDWDPAKFTVEDSAFGFIVMENGATISLDASWALNTLEVREACCMICGTEAGADMFHGVTRINGVRNNRQYVLTPSFSSGGVAFYDGINDNDPSAKEAYQWIQAVRERKNPTVLPEQAFTVTRILEGIYESAKTGEVYRF